MTVVGWFRPDGKLWQPTNNVTLYSPMLFPTQSGSLPLGIQSVIYSQDANGSITTLTLVLPNGLSNRPLAGVPDATVGGPAASAAATNTSDAAPDVPDTMMST